MGSPLIAADCDPDRAPPFDSSREPIDPVGDNDPIGS
jgi:hypothetical protein